MDAQSNSAANTAEALAQQHYPRSDGRQWSKKGRILPISAYLAREDGTIPANVELSLGLTKTIKTWTLPEDLLGDHSPYFRAIFKGDFKDAQNQKLSLDDEVYTEQAVSYLIDWMYTGKLECRAEHDLKKYNSTHDQSWYSLYLLADMLDMFWLAKATIARIGLCLEEGGWVPNKSEICFVYARTMEKSVLRELVVTHLVDAYIEKTEKDFGEEVEHWTDTVGCQADFHCAVMKEVKLHTDLVECDRPTTCRFHFHHKPARRMSLIR